MTEHDVVAKIQELKNIKPRQEWVFSVKNRIFAEHPYIAKKQVSLAEAIKSWVFQPRMAYASLLLLIGIFFSAFGFAQNALPGDFLYSFKKIGEESQAIFVLNNTEQSRTQLMLLNKRLDELTEVAQKNKVRNLAPAINEVENSIVQAAKKLKQADADSQIVSEAKKIENKTETIRSLGVEIGDLEWDGALVQKIKEQVDILSADKLTAEQATLLEEVKKHVEEEEYVDAWEKVLLINGIIIE